MKKLICIISVITVFSMFTAYATQIPDSQPLQDDILTTVTVTDLDIVNAEAVRQYELLTIYFEKYGYPQYYAGSYIDKTQHLHIMLTQSATLSDIEAIKSIVECEQPLFDYDAHYSYSELMSYRNQIRTYFNHNRHEKNDILDNLVSVEIDEQNNVLNVGLVDSSSSKVSIFLEDIFPTQLQEKSVLPINFSSAEQLDLTALAESDVDVRVSMPIMNMAVALVYNMLNLLLP